MVSLLDWLVENDPSFRKNRLPSLYSDLSVQKTTNPEGYSANVTTWQSALTTAALAGKLPSHQKLVIEVSDEILEELSSAQYGKPSGLGLVLDDSVRAGKMIDSNEFMNLEHSIFQRSRIPSLSAIVTWGLRQTKLFGPSSYNLSGQLRNGELVVVAALEDISKQICAARANKPQSLSDRILTRDDFREGISKSCKTSFTAKEESILLKFMSRDKELLSYDENTVKFKASSSETPHVVTKEDATIATIKSLVSKLETQEQELEKRSQDLKAKAMTAVQNKNHQAGISALKQKKMVEKVLQQRVDTMHQLQNILIKIEQASDQVQIIEVMQASASVLKDLNNRVDSVERVDDIMEDMREQMIKTDEVGTVLQESLNPDAVIDESEVDDELAAMEKGEREAQERRDSAATRVRMEELDGFERSKASENALQSSIEQLKRLDITTGSKAGENDKVAEQVTN